MKFIFLTDTHIRGKNPINRKGDYFQDMKAKIDEVCDLSRKENCDFVIHGGDFFDSPSVSLNVCDEIVDIIEHAKVDWHVVRGNHDEIGHNPNLSGQSILDHLFRRTSYINHLEAFTDCRRRMYIQGFDYYHNLESDLLEKGLKINNPEILQIPQRIAVVHAYIIDKVLPYSHILMQQLKSDFNLVLVGHYHDYYGVKKVNGVTYIGLGSLCRMSLSPSDINRAPSVLIVDTDKKPFFQFYPLQSAKPSKEIFDLENMIEMKEKERSIDDFINSLQSTKVQSLNFADIVQEIADKNNIEKRVVDEIINRIGAAENVILQSGD